MSPKVIMRFNKSVHVHIKIDEIKVGKLLASVRCGERRFTFTGEEKVKAFKDKFKVGDIINVVAEGPFVVRISKGIDLEV